jgi:hypothetical protein
VIVTRTDKRALFPVKLSLVAEVARCHLFGLLALATAGAAAQTMGDLAAFREAGAAVGPGGDVGGVSGGRGLFITPTLSSNLTLTDNVNLSSTNKQSALILGITPGISLGWQLGRNQGSLSY